MSNPLLVPELREYLTTGDREAIRGFCEEMHAATVAEFLSALEPEECWQVLSYLDGADRTLIFSHLDTEFQIEVVSTLDRRAAVALLTHMAHDDRADLVKALPEESIDRILPAMAHAEREDIRRLTSYEEGTAGSVMTSDYATLNPEMTVSEAIARLRLEAPDKETIYYTYVIDTNRKLLGFLSLKDLILARPSARVGDLMQTEVIRALVSDDREAAARSIQRYDLLALPVVDANEALVGIITHDDALDIITEEHTEDLEKLMAIAGEHDGQGYLKTTAWQHFRNRAGWIVALAALGLVSGLIIHGFEATLVQVMILALYMPMVADTGGNTGSQSATVVVRALALQQITPRDVLKVLLKELEISAMLAVLLGVLSWAKVMFLSQGDVLEHGLTLGRVGMAIAVALSLQVISSTLIGALLPLAAARFKLDPAVVASPALTTIVDISGLLLYFGVARLMLGI